MDPRNDEKPKGYGDAWKAFLAVVSLILSLFGFILYRIDVIETRQLDVRERLAAQEARMRYHEEEDQRQFNRFRQQQ